MTVFESVCLRALLVIFQRFSTYNISILNSNKFVWLVPPLAVLLHGGEFSGLFFFLNDGQHGNDQRIRTKAMHNGQNMDLKVV